MNEAGTIPGSAALPSGGENQPGPSLRPTGEEDRPPHAPKGWHSRGYLPHFDNPLVIQHVSFHLADSLPQAVVHRLDEELKALPTEKVDAERRKRIDAWIDAGYGSCVLRDPIIAEQIQQTLWHFDGLRYRLLAWVVMPNHVHSLFESLHDWPLGKIVASWKRRMANVVLAGSRLSPPVWHPEYWDRYVRNEKHLAAVIEYIHQNPVKAGLAKRADEWRWSSAFAGER